jgi:hypothetical protein
MMQLFILAVFLLSIALGVLLVIWHGRAFGTWAYGKERETEDERLWHQAMRA